MIIRGIEDPLGPNEQIYSIREADGKIELCDFALPGVIRESFVHRGDTSDQKRAQNDVAHSLLAHLEKPAHWILAWEHHVEGDQRRSRVLANQVKKAGYVVLQRDGVGVASVGVGNAEDLLSPPGVAWGQCGWFIAIGKPPGLDAWTSPPLCETTRFLARTHRLQPSKEFIIGLVGLELSILYTATDSRDGIAWISIHSDRDDILTNPDGVVATFRGVQADEAWAWTPGLHTV